MPAIKRKGKHRLKVFLAMVGFAVIVAAIALPVSVSGRPTYDYTRIPCSSCHDNGGTATPVPGLLTITGLPASYTPGVKYPITVTMADSNGATGQNNFVMTTDKGTMSTGYAGVQIQNVGLAARGNDTVGGYKATVWKLNWTAPTIGSGATTLVFWGVNGDGAGGTLDPFGNTNVVVPEGAIPEFSELIIPVLGIVGTLFIVRMARKSKD